MIIDLIILIVNVGVLTVGYLQFITMRHVLQIEKCVAKDVSVVREHEEQMAENIITNCCNCTKRKENLYD